MKQLFSFAKQWCVESIKGLEPFSEKPASIYACSKSLLGLCLLAGMICKERRLVKESRY